MGTRSMDPTEYAQRQELGEALAEEGIDIQDLEESDVQELLTEMAEDGEVEEDEGPPSDLFEDVLPGDVSAAGGVGKILAARGYLNADKIAAASSVYLLMGICWGVAYALMYEATPEAFNLTGQDLEAPASALIHFSFTTLTTVGYGNISPMTHASRALSDIESVMGQLYLTIVVARLVSLQVAAPQGQPD